MTKARDRKDFSYRLSSSYARCPLLAREEAVLFLSKTKTVHQPMTLAAIMNTRDSNQNPRIVSTKTGPLASLLTLNFYVAVTLNIRKVLSNKLPVKNAITDCPHPSENTRNQTMFKEKDCSNIVILVLSYLPYWIMVWAWFFLFYNFFLEHCNCSLPSTFMVTYYFWNCRKITDVLTDLCMLGWKE